MKNQMIDLENVLFTEIRLFFSIYFHTFLRILYATPQNELEESLQEAFRNLEEI